MTSVLWSVDDAMIVEFLVASTCLRASSNQQWYRYAPREIALQIYSRRGLENQAQAELHRAANELVVIYRACADKFRYEAMKGAWSWAQYTQRPMNLFTPLIEFLLPTLCMVCEKAQNKLLCVNCLAQIKERSFMQKHLCTVCGIPIAAHESTCKTCLENPPNFDATFYIDSYDGVLQTAMHALKYQKRLACATGFAYLWNHSAGMVNSESSIDFLLPVPLNQQKLAARGFNQSWEIAKNLELSEKIRRVPNALLRRNNEISQVGRDKANRKKAVHGQFYIHEIWSKQFENKSIVLFDDVMTTGSTMNTIASLLKNHGAKHVSAWVILRTLPKFSQCAI